MQSRDSEGSENKKTEAKRRLKNRKYGLKGKSEEREDTARLKKSRFNGIEKIVTNTSKKRGIQNVEITDLKNLS